MKRVAGEKGKKVGSEGNTDAPCVRQEQKKNGKQKENAGRRVERLAR